MQPAPALQFLVGDVKVHITQGRTKTEWEWGNEIADKVIEIGDEAPQPIRDQAHAFRQKVMLVVALNVAAAVREERAACAELALINGSSEAAAAIRAR